MSDYMDDLINKIDSLTTVNKLPLWNEKFAGKYKIDNININLKTKPNIIHRFFMRVLLGFKWINN